MEKVIHLKKNNTMSVADAIAGNRPLHITPRGAHGLPFNVTVPAAVYAAVGRVFRPPAPRAPRRRRLTRVHKFLERICHVEASVSSVLSLRYISLGALFQAVSGGHLAAEHGVPQSAVDKIVSAIREHE